MPDTAAPETVADIAILDDDADFRTYLEDFLNDEGLYTVRAYMVCTTAGNTQYATATINFADGMGASPKSLTIGGVECNTLTNEAATPTQTFYTDGLSPVTITVTYAGGTGAWQGLFQLIA